MTKCHSAQLQVPGCFRRNDSSGSGAVVLRSDARPRELAGPHSDIPSISFILGPSSSCASFRGSNRGRMGGHCGTLCAPGPASGPTLPGRGPSLSSYQRPANSRLHPHCWDRANDRSLDYFLEQSCLPVLVCPPTSVLLCKRRMNFFAI